MTLLALLASFALAGEAKHGPQPALAALERGNQRFATGHARHPRQDGATRKSLASTQKPSAIVLSCSDSRVPPEIVFDQGLGQVFTVRTAGEVAASPELASIEYAVEHLGAGLIVVLGHDSCGAVKSALETPAGRSAGSPYLDELLSSIRPNVEGHRGDASDKTLSVPVRAQAAAVAGSLTERSKLLKEAVEKGHLSIVPAVYHLDSGRVEFLR